MGQDTNTALLSRVEMLEKRLQQLEEFIDAGLYSTEEENDYSLEETDFQ